MVACSAWKVFPKVIVYICQKLSFLPTQSRYSNSSSYSRKRNKIPNYWIRTRYPRVCKVWGSKHFCKRLMKWTWNVSLLVVFFFIIFFCRLTKENRMERLSITVSILLSVFVSMSRSSLPDQAVFPSILLTKVVNHESFPGKHYSEALSAFLLGKQWSRPADNPSSEDKTTINKWV